MRTFAPAAAALLLFAGSAGAAWAPLGTGQAAARARTMPAGNAPSGTASVGQTVALTWAASAFSGGGAVGGYVVKRYDLLGAPQTVGGSCAGLVVATTCTETAVPLGTWQYTVTPARGSWRGSESAKSLPVVVTV